MSDDERGKGGFVVIGQGRWGFGENLIRAKKYFTVNGGNLKVAHSIVHFDDATEFKGVDQMGRIHYEGNEPTSVDVETTLP